MSAVVHARVVEQLTRLRLRYVAERLDAVLGDAARHEPTYRSKHFFRYADNETCAL